eukprot:Skav201959  [mRNA]  locus=scaffold103:209139:211104:+ [translate_table: standard]
MAPSHGYAAEMDDSGESQASTLLRLCFDSASSGGVCFEEDGVRLGQWRYQGHGQGAYEKVEDLKFVGEGRGSWDREVLPAGWRCRWTSLCLCFLLLTLAAIAVAYVMFSKFGSAVGAMDVPGFSPVAFDCSLEVEHWETFWTDEKKAWRKFPVCHGWKTKEKRRKRRKEGFTAADVERCRDCGRPFAVVMLVSDVQNNRSLAQSARLLQLVVLTLR